MARVLCVSRDTTWRWNIVLIKLWLMHAFSCSSPPTVLYVYVRTHAHSFPHTLSLSLSLQELVLLPFISFYLHKPYSLLTRTTVLNFLSFQTVQFEESLYDGGFMFIVGVFQIEKKKKFFFF